MTEYYLHTEVFYQFVSTGDPRAADAAPPVQETNEEDTAPLARTGKTAQNAEAPLQAANNENDAPSTIQDLPNVEPYYQVDEQETEEPNTAADNQNTIQHVPNSVPYYQNDVQETEEPDWGRDSENEGSAHQQESLDAKPGAEDNSRATAAANPGDRRDRERGSAVPLGQQRPAEPEGLPPPRRRGRSETDARDATTATRRPPDALQRQRNQRDRAKWRAKRAAVDLHQATFETVGTAGDS